MRNRPVSVDAQFNEIARTWVPTLPVPGSGQTWRRFEALSNWAASDLSLGRLIEGHADALAILAEAGKEPATPQATYGVWAARAPQGGTTASRTSEGWRLSGHKSFCSGHGIIERALVTAECPDGYRLFDISVAENVVNIQGESWQAVGMADSQSHTLELGGTPIGEDRVIGESGFYLERPGFWFGAIGVAACWYGGARGLLSDLTESMTSLPSDDVLAELGRAVAHVESMRTVLAQAAQAIDADPKDLKQSAQRSALVVRHAVHHGATQVLAHFGAAAGARPLCHDRAQARRAADLYVYLAQHHGPRDAVELARLAIGGA
jgi:alkylation response protein AidB-like acyl-CoA dehydrogenase